MANELLKYCTEELCTGGDGNVLSACQAIIAVTVIANNPDLSLANAAAVLLKKKGPARVKEASECIIIMR